MSDKSAKQIALDGRLNLVEPQKAGDERLLAEFRYACDHWLPSMTPKARAEAMAYAAEAVAKPKP